MNDSIKHHHHESDERADEYLHEAPSPMCPSPCAEEEDDSMVYEDKRSTISDEDLHSDGCDSYFAGEALEISYGIAQHPVAQEHDQNASGHMYAKGVAEDVHDKSE